MTDKKETDARSAHRGPILQLEQISKVFHTDGGGRFRALKSVDLTIPQGSCVGIVGESGSGKSTLARVVCHLTAATGGNIIFKGQDITRLKGPALKRYYQQVQMIFQDPLGTFSPRMRIGDYMAEPFLNFGMMDKRKAREYSASLLERVGLPANYLKRLPSMLSGGQLQRIVIARAIGLKPDLIVCDECTSALDVTIQSQALDLFQGLREETGFSSLFITHDLALAESTCDIIYVMYNGEVVEILSSDNISDEASHPYTVDLLDSVFDMEPILAGS